MREIAKYYISDKFVITGRGLFFVGYILEGKISIGDLIQFSFNDKLMARKIMGVEMTSNPLNFGKLDKVSMGLLIECHDDEEIKQIRNSNLKDIEALIFES